jgi:hypothetical protein
MDDEQATLRHRDIFGFWLHQLEAIYFRLWLSPALHCRLSASRDCCVGACLTTHSVVGGR